MSNRILGRFEQQWTILMQSFKHTATIIAIAVTNHFNYRIFFQLINYLIMLLPKSFNNCFEDFWMSIEVAGSNLSATSRCILLVKSLLSRVTKWVFLIAQNANQPIFVKITHKFYLGNKYHTRLCQWWISHKTAQGKKSHKKRKMPNLVTLLLSCPMWTFLGVVFFQKFQEVFFCWNVVFRKCRSGQFRVKFPIRRGSEEKKMIIKIRAPSHDNEKE
jgi:hypothetical protein